MLQSISRACQERYIRNLRQRKCSEMLKILFLSLLIVIIFCSLVDSCCSNRRKLSEDSKRKLEKLLNRKKLKANDRFVRRFCERPPRPPSTGSGSCCKYPISTCSEYFGRIEVPSRKLMQKLTETMFEVVGDREGMTILAKICPFAGHLE